MVVFYMCLKFHDETWAPRRQAWHSEVLPNCAKRPWVWTSLSALNFAGIRLGSYNPSPGPTLCGSFYALGLSFLDPSSEMPLIFHGLVLPPSHNIRHCRYYIPYVSIWNVIMSYIMGWREKSIRHSSSYCMISTTWSMAKKMNQSWAQSNQSAPTTWGLTWIGLGDGMRRQAGSKWFLWETSQCI